MTEIEKTKDMSSSCMNDHAVVVCSLTRKVFIHTRTYICMLIHTHMLIHAYIHTYIYQETPTSILIDYMSPTQRHLRDSYAVKQHTTSPPPPPPQIFNEESAYMRESGHSLTQDFLSEGCSAGQKTGKDDDDKGKETHIHTHTYTHTYTHI